MAASITARAQRRAVGNWHFRGHVFCTFYDPSPAQPPLNGGCWTAIKVERQLLRVLPGRPHPRAALRRRPAGHGPALERPRLAPGGALDLPRQAQRLSSLEVGHESSCATAPICRYSSTPFPLEHVEDSPHVHIARALHRRQLGQAQRSQEARRHEPRQQQADRRAGACLQGRPRQGAGGCRQGLQDLAPGVRLRARQDPAQGRRPACARAPTRSPRCSPRSRARC